MPAGCCTPAPPLQETTLQPGKKSARRGSLRWAGWAAAAVVLLAAVPNASPAAAAALADVPVLGTIVRLVTFRTYTYDDGHSAADVSVPQLEGSGAAEAVSDEVRAYTDQLIAQFQKDCQAVGEGYQGLDITSRVVTDSSDWFTLRIDAVETKASGYQFSRLYHIDKATGAQVTLKDLFRPDADYVSVLSDEVRRQMEEQMAKDDSQAYFPEEFTAIAPTRTFTGMPTGTWCWCLMSTRWPPAPWECRSLSFPRPSAENWKDKEDME